MSPLKVGDYVLMRGQARVLYRITRPISKWFDTDDDCEWIVVDDHMYEMQLIDKYKTAQQLREEWGFVSVKRASEQIMVLVSEQK